MTWRNRKQRQPRTPSVEKGLAKAQPPIDLGVEDAFQSIRYNRNTQLENQKLALSLLDATEATIKQGGLAITPENYFIALWPLVDNEEKEETGKMGKGQAMDFNAAIMYLLSFVAPKLSQEFIREHYSLIYAKLPSAMIRFLTVAPFVRAGIILIQAIISAFLDEDWAEKPSLLEIHSLLLQLCTDARPKVRKLAQETLLALSQLYSINREHPSRRSVLLFLSKTLIKSSRKNPEEALHITPLLRAMLPEFSPEEVYPLTKPLLEASSWGNNHLTILIWNLLSFHFDRILDRQATELPGYLTSIEEVRSFLLKSTPALNVTELIPSWLRCFYRATLARDHLEQLSHSILTEEYFKIILELLSSPETTVLQAVEEALRNSYRLVREHQVATLVLQGIGRWLQVKNSPQAPYVIRSAGDFSQEVGIEILPIAGDLIITLATMHDSKQGKHATIIEATLGRFVTRCGSAAILELIPLNLETKGAVPRAWILPILRDTVSHANLAYFLDELLPLTDRLSVKHAEYVAAGKVHDAKVYQVIIHQIWTTLGAYMTFPLDFSAVFPRLAPHLGKHLNTTVPLRPVICNALTSFIQRSLSLQNDLEMSAGEETCSRSKADLELLAQFVGNFLPILFNIYGITKPDQRDYILKTIEAFLSIALSETVEAYLGKLLGRLQPLSPPSELASFLELSVVLMRAITGHNAQVYLEKLMDAVTPLIHFADVTVQKRAYYVIGDLLAREDFSPSWDKLEEELTVSYQKQSKRMDSAVKKGRFRMLLRLCSQLADEQLHWIPIFLPEVVLGVKEVNQQTRLCAFELLSAFARRMSRGGTIRAAATHGMLVSDAEANLQEYLNMLIAGLASATPHMISATIMALARVIFEMRLSLGVESLSTLFGDIIAMLHSPSKEVVKAAIGFIKVSIVALKSPAQSASDGMITTGPSIIEGHLPELIVGLLGWSNEHHQQFKVKVRHLIERLVRQFGFEEVWKLTPPAHHKLLSNIRKRRERAKRRKDVGAEDGYDNEGDELTSTVDRHQSLEALTSAALSKSTMVTKMTKNTMANSRANSAQSFDSAFHDSESELDSDFDGDEDGHYDMTADSILHDIAGLEDDDEAIEAVLSKKLFLANALSKKAGTSSSTKRGRPTDNDDADEADHQVKVDDEGHLIIEDEEGEEDVASDSDDEDRPQRNKSVSFAKVQGKGGFSSRGDSQAAPKRRRNGDAKRKGEKFEPYSYLPMTRGSKKSTGGSSTAAAGGKKLGPKYYMKRS